MNMKKKIIILAFSLISIANVSASDSLKIVNLQREVSNLKVSVSRLQQENAKIRGLYQQQKMEGDSLKKEMGHQGQVTDSIAQKFDSELLNTNDMLEGTASQLSKISFVYFIIGICGILLFAAIAFVLHYLLRKKIKLSSSAIDKIKSAQDSLETAQKVMQEESVKLDNKLVELLDKQVTLQPQDGGNDQIDHSLALKVADEIVRIETNLSRMDESVKGYKQLKKAVERIRTNFLANGYEIVEMLGKPYNEGMKVVANFVSDDTLGEGEQKITGIIKPQINYKGKMIQSAQITVSQNL